MGILTKRLMGTGSVQDSERKIYFWCKRWKEMKQCWSYLRRISRAPLDDGCLVLNEAARPFVNLRVFPVTWQPPLLLLFLNPKLTLWLLWQFRLVVTIFRPWCLLMHTANIYFCSSALFQSPPPCLFTIVHHDSSNNGIQYWSHSCIVHCHPVYRKYWSIVLNS